MGNKCYHISDFVRNDPKKGVERARKEGLGWLLDAIEANLNVNPENIATISIKKFDDGTFDRIHVEFNWL